MNTVPVYFARVLYYTTLERPVKDKHTTLLSSFVIYEEKKCSEYGQVYFARVLYYTTPKRPVKDKHSSLLSSIVSYKENKVL